MCLHRQLNMSFTANPVVQTANLQLWVVHRPHIHEAQGFELRVTGAFSVWGRRHVFTPFFMGLLQSRCCSELWMSCIFTVRKQQADSDQHPTIKTGRLKSTHSAVSPWRRLPVAPLSQMSKAKSWLIWFFFTSCANKPKHVRMIQFFFWRVTLNS